jgi:hypothetical protein
MTTTPDAHLTDAQGAESRLPKPPIKSGWRGNLCGAIEGTEASWIETSEVTLKLDAKTAYALANMLTDSSLEAACCHRLSFEALSNLGAALGRLIDHPSANNGGREIVK